MKVTTSPVPLRVPVAITTGVDASEHTVAEVKVVLRGHLLSVVVPPEDQVTVFVNCAVVIVPELLIYANWAAFELASGIAPAAAPPTVALG